MKLTPYAKSYRHYRILQPLLCLTILSLMQVTSFYAQSSNENIHRVLLIFWYNKDFPANGILEQNFRDKLNSLTTGSVEYYSEYFESNRFVGPGYENTFRDYLKQKYGDKKLDAIVATPDPTLEFLLKYRQGLFPDTPIIFTAVKNPQIDSSGHANLTGIILASTHRETIDLALKLHPDTEQVFAISGTPRKDKRYEEAARHALEGYPGPVKFNYLTDLPLNELVARTSTLPPHSMILWLWQQSQDDQGRLLETNETLSVVARSASVPIYTMSSMNVGYGAMGGFVIGPESNGVRVAEIVATILKGERAQDQPIANAPAVPTFDFRQLKRWHISEGLLPPGSVVRFREYTFWELYKWRILGVVAVFALQLTFIAILLVERRKRQRARNELSKLNSELEHRIEARTAALNSKSQELEIFAYSVAHDLKAPLRGIDGYSRLLLEDHKDSLNDEGQMFVNTIYNSTHEMTQLIEDLLDYSRLERSQINTDPIELRPLVNAAVEQKQREAEATNRDIEFVVEVNGGVVLADANGLSQALKNYIDNAIKFTRSVPRARIEIGSKETTKNCLLWVRDNGVGFDMKYHHRIFDIFQRLNRTEEYPGTGIGLAIVRKEMERMGGRAWAESELGQGATFYLEIPK